MRRLSGLGRNLNLGIAAGGLALRGLPFAPLQLFLLFLQLAAVAIGALLVVVGLESHVGSFALLLTGATRFGAGGCDCRSSGFPVRGLLCEAQRAQARRLLDHRVMLALLLDLQGRFLLLASA